MVKARFSHLCVPWGSTAGDTGKRRFLNWPSSADGIAPPAEMLPFTTDRWLRVLGVAAAFGSAAFATFMISQNGSQHGVRGVEHQSILVRARRARLSGFHSYTSNSEDRFAVTRALDYDTTGSISIKDVRTPVKNTVPTSNIEGSAAFKSGGTSSYRLRFVHNGGAVLQGERGFYIARRGTVLPGAGKVLSIGRLGDGWIIVTTTEVFTQVGDDRP